jgi:hypothetical protein
MILDSIQQYNKPTAQNTDVAIKGRNSNLGEKKIGWITSIKIKRHVIKTKAM